MDKKKLIGTIIGVIAFIALIAGATFAFLQNSINITNGRYNNATGEFKFEYTNANNVTSINPTNITSVPILDSTTDFSEMTDESTGKYVMQITKTAKSPSAELFLIVFDIQNNLTTSSLCYQVCEATNVTNCTGTINGNCLEAGTYSYGIYTSTSDFNTTGLVTKTYNIYFWLDKDTLANDDIGKTVTGYIYAEASQHYEPPV